MTDPQTLPDHMFQQIADEKYARLIGEAAARDEEARHVDQ